MKKILEELEALSALINRYLNSLDSTPFSFSQNEEEQKKIEAHYASFSLRVAKHLSALDDALCPISRKVLQADTDCDNEMLSGAIRLLDGYTAYRRSLVSLLDELDHTASLTPLVLITAVRRMAELTKNASLTLCE